MAAIEAEVVQQDTTTFGQVYKVDWIILDTNGVELRTIWKLELRIPTHV